jgi:hypothetical protein
MYFLDWNSEFQPSSICVTAPHLAKLADMTGAPPASTQVDVARMCVSWWSSNSTPGVMWWKWMQLFGWCRSQGTNTLQMDRDKCCPQVVRRVHCEAERVCRVGEDMYLSYILQTNIVGLTDPIYNYSQFGIVRHRKTSYRPVIIEVPLMPEAESRN